MTAVEAKPPEPPPDCGPQRPVPVGGD